MDKPLNPRKRISLAQLIIGKDFIKLSFTQVHRRGISMTVKPLADRIVIRRFEADEKTAGGIILPDNAKNKPHKGKILAVGPGKMIKDGSRRPLQIKEGETVIFTSWAGDEFKEQKTRGNILLMREEDVLAVVDE